MAKFLVCLAVWILLTAFSALGTTAMAAAMSPVVIAVALAFFGGVYAFVFLPCLPGEPEVPRGWS